ncbi:MAG: Smr domain protein [Labilithrix sp.]|nr:Smr domain protein [Labilithrix sp.]
MAKKRDAGKKKKDDDAALPKFGGFHPLAGGLEGFKAKLDAEKKTEEDRQKAAAAKGKPLPPPPRPAARPEPSRTPPARTATSDLDDEMSFHRMMSGVTPLDGAAKNRVPVTTEVKPGEQRMKAAEVKAKAAVEAEQALAHLHSIVDDAARFEVSDDGQRVEGRRVDVPPDLVRSLRRGMLPVDGRLDLHGLTAHQAQDRLVEFLRTMRARNERCVLVIHGKGERVAGSGVLRGEIAAWLSQGKAREHVAAFATARDDDGGEGAVYVALRR